MRKRTWTHWKPCKKQVSADWSRSVPPATWVPHLFPQTLVFFPSFLSRPHLAEVSHLKEYLVHFGLSCGQKTTNDLLQKFCMWFSNDIWFMTLCQYPKTLWLGPLSNQPKVLWTHLLQDLSFSTSWPMLRPMFHPYHTSWCIKNTNSNSDFSRTTSDYKKSVAKVIRSVLSWRLLECAIPKKDGTTKMFS